MILNYHSSVKTKELTKHCKVVQIMLSPYRHPSKDTWKIYAPWGIDQKVVFHLDYFRTAPRYSFMTKRRQKALVGEIVGFLTLPKSSGIDCGGVVIHLDSVFSMDAFKAIQPNMDLFGYAAMYFSSQMYGSPKDSADVLARAKFFQDDPLSFSTAVEVQSVSQLFVDIEKALDGRQVTSKLLLENTTKNLRGNSFMGDKEIYFDDRIVKLPSFVGRCYDFEHGYATGWYSKLDDIPLAKCDFIHLNALPQEVEYGSYRDRHSQTTLQEGKIPFEDYLKFVEKLDKNNIPYVREVDIETLKREIEWLKKL